MRSAEDWLADQIGDRTDDFAPGESDYALAFIRRIQADAVRELVALKNIKDRLEGGYGIDTDDRAPLHAEYDRRKPLAWAAARALVAQVPAE